MKMYILTVFIFKDVDELTDEHNVSNKKGFESERLLFYYNPFPNL